MEDIEKQIEKTSKLLYSMEKDVFTQTILENQILIMEKLQELNEPDYGPAG